MIAQVKSSVLRVVLKISFVAGVVWVTPLSGLACGFQWSPPGGYFECCDSAGFVMLSEKVADLAIPGEDGTVPVWAFFSSENAVPNPYAGLWRIGILDISLVPVGESQYRMRDPGGNETILSRNKKDNTVLEGPGWKGTITKDTIKLWASCGWSVEFYKGKISKINTSKNKTLTYNYAGDRISGITCAGKPLLTVDSVKDDALDITIDDKKLTIVKAGQPHIQRAGETNEIRTTVQSLSKITGAEESRRSYAYTMNEKKQPVITVTDRSQEPFKIVWNPQTRKILRCKDWEFTKTRDRKNQWDTIELTRTNSTQGVESYYRDIQGGVSKNQWGASARSEHRFTSGPAAGKVRKIEDTVDGKVTHLQQYAYDEKGRMIRGQENEDRFKYEYDDKKRTATAWKNNTLLWKKTMDAKERILKVEYPDGKELRITHYDNRPSTAELVWKGASVAVQLNSDGWIKDGSEVVKGIPAKKL